MILSFVCCVVHIQKWQVDYLVQNIMTNNYYNICYEVIVFAIHTNSIVSETLSRILVKIKRVKKCYDQLAAYYYKKRYQYEYNERYIETVITKIVSLLYKCLEVRSYVRETNIRNLIPMDMYILWCIAPTNLDQDSLFFKAITITPLVNEFLFGVKWNEDLFTIVRSYSNAWKFTLISYKHYLSYWAFWFLIERRQIQLALEWIEYIMKFSMSRYIALSTK